MNHYLSLLIVSLCIAAVFAMVTKEDTNERFHYFLMLLTYMVLGSLVAAWIMSWVPW